jgi:hypothetical protein
VLVSVPLLDVIVKLVPALLADIRKNPGAPPSACEVSNNLLFAVTLVVFTVAEPATSVAVLMVALVPS